MRSNIDGRANRNLTYIIVSVVAAALILLATIAVRCLGVLVSPRQTLMLQLGVVLVLLGFTTAVIVAGNRDFEALGSTAPLGRAFGEGAAFLFSMLLIPTSKHVGIGVLIGSSYERMLWLHPFLGCFFFLILTTHFAYMAIRGVKHPSDIFDTEYPIVLYGFLTWLCTCVIVIVSLFFRRKSYWTFRVVHVLILAAIAFSLNHLSTLRVMLIPGLVLWALDLVLRCVSAYRASATVQAATNHSSGTTMLELTVGWSEAPQPGSYAFLLIPTLSLVMHPFTVARFEPNEGSRGGGVATFHIKGVGPFTTALRSLVSTSSNSFRVFVFGPHGCLQVPLEKCKRVVLLAGGIGITPMLSILQNLATTAYPMLEEVHVVWSAQSQGMLDLHYHEITAYLGKLQQPAQISSFHAHCTANAAEMVEHSTEPNGGTGAAADTATIVSGRPQFDEYLKGWEAQYGQKATGVYVCGPPAMMESATAAAEASGSWIHTETFFF